MTITKLATYEANMIEWGGYLDDMYDSGSVNDETALANSYYDSQESFYQIADYTGDNAWLTSADKAQEAYATYYVGPAGGNVPGYWNFTHGLTQDWLRNADTNAKASVVSLSENGAYAKDSPNTVAELADPNLSRENAYAGMAHINAERCGEARRSRLTSLVDNALTHIDRWCVLQNADFFRPFMGALTARFLIHYWEYINQDSRIPPAIATLYTYGFQSCWDDAANSWNYTDRDMGVPEDLDPQADLNLLIVPPLGWLWLRTGEENWRTMGDRAFDGGVSVYDGEGFHQSGAWLGSPSATGISGKQFNQSYVWSARYIEWRDGVPDTETPGEPVVATPTPTSRSAVVNTFESFMSLIR